MRNELEEMKQQIAELRAELTSAQGALSLVLSAEHRALVYSKDLRRAFQEIVRDLRKEEELDRARAFASIASQAAASMAQASINPSLTSALQASLNQRIK